MAERIDIVIADGAEYLAANTQHYDLVLVDGFDENARSGRLNTVDFYQAVRAHLSNVGIMAVNLLGHSRGFEVNAERIRAAFSQRSLVFPSCDSGNTIVFAATGDPVCMTLYELRKRAAILKENTYLNLLPTLTRVEQAQTCRGGILSI